MKRQLSILGAVAFTALSAFGKQLPQAKVTVKVSDEAGQPVEGARAGVGFGVTGTMGRSRDDVSSSGKTDQNGEFSASSRCQSLIGYTASKDGYYKTVSDMYVFKPEKNGRWQPWNPTLELVLKKKINPIPMYVKEVSKLPIPKLNEPVGYDLCVGDWVEPYGKGKIGDFLIQVKRDYKDRENLYYEMMISFSNPDDGILAVNIPFAGKFAGSELRFPHEAPSEGYEPYFCSWALGKGKIRDQKDRPIHWPGNDTGGDNDWIFRVRSKKLPDGSVAGLYGKIDRSIMVGDIHKEPSTTGFTYYLNPTGTRNLEFKPGWNIFDWQKPFVKYGDGQGGFTLSPPESSGNFPP